MSSAEHPAPSDTAFCEQCGSRVGANARFCDACGAAQPATFGEAPGIVTPIAAAAGLGGHGEPEAATGAIPLPELESETEAEAATLAMPHPEPATRAMPLPGPQPTTAAKSPPPNRRTRRRAILALSVVVVLAAGGAGLYLALRHHQPPRITAQRAATLGTELSSGRPSEVRDAVATPRGITLDPTGIKALTTRSFTLDAKSFSRVGSDHAYIAARVGGARGAVERWQVLLVYSGGRWKLDDTRKGVS